MLFQVVTENGVKTIKALTADTGAGAPVGTIIAFYGNTAPSGYLTCDGRQFDKNTYPVLYALLGDNHTPDLRECTLKMVGENPNGASHVKSGGLGVGEFLDDRIQNITGTFGVRSCNSASGDTTSTASGAFTLSDMTANADRLEVQSGSYKINYVNLDASNVARTGVTTEVKAVGVNYCIKATSGLTENQQENVLNTINENLSYSTTEHATGKKWIDGKPIYGKTVICRVSGITGTAHNISNLNEITKIEAKSLASNGETRPIPFCYFGNLEWSCGIYVNNTNIMIEAGSNFSTSHTTATVTLEYTKTN